MPQKKKSRLRRPQGQLQHLPPELAPQDTITQPMDKGQPYDPSLLMGPQVLPPDPIYTSDVGASNLNYEDIIAGINYDRTQVGQTYGFDQAGNLDPSNPYSVAANLQRNYQIGQRATNTGFASRGQLYSGSYQRSQDDNTFQYSRNYDSARRTAMGAYRDLLEREGRANFDHTTQLNDAASDRLGRVDPATVTPQTTSIPRTEPIKPPKNIPSFLKPKKKPKKK